MYFNFTDAALGVSIMFGYFALDEVKIWSFWGFPICISHDFPLSYGILKTRIYCSEADPGFMGPEAQNFGGSLKGKTID